MVLFQQLSSAPPSAAAAVATPTATATAAAMVMVPAAALPTTPHHPHRQAVDILGCKAVVGCVRACLLAQGNALCS